MALSNVNQLNVNQYEAKRNAHLKKYENADLANGNTDDLDAHFEGVSIAIGYGYDLKKRASKLYADLKDFITVKDSTLDESASIEEINQEKEETLREVSKIVNDSTSSQAVADSVNKLITLGNEENASLLLSQSIEEFENEINSKLGVNHNLPLSDERVAVVSQMYRLGKGGIPSLLDAIKEDNRAEAWYQIRYSSNATSKKLSGTAKRVVEESNLFRLYVGELTHDIAKNIMRMYTRDYFRVKKATTQKESLITREEKKYSSIYGGNESIKEQLKPVKEFLINKIPSIINNHGRKINPPVEGEVFVTKGLQSYSYFDNKNSEAKEPLISSEKGDLIYAQNESKEDVITLKNGKNYVLNEKNGRTDYHIDDGTHYIFDKSKDSKIFINSKVLSFPGLSQKKLWEEIAYNYYLIDDLWRLEILEKEGENGICYDLIIRSKKNENLTIYVVGFNNKELGLDISVALEGKSNGPGDSPTNNVLYYLGSLPVGFKPIESEYILTTGRGNYTIPVNPMTVNLIAHYSGLKEAMSPIPQFGIVCTHDEYGMAEIRFY